MHASPSVSDTAVPSDNNLNAELPESVNHISALAESASVSVPPSVKQATSPSVKTRYHAYKSSMYFGFL